MIEELLVKGYINEWFIAELVDELIDNYNVSAKATARICIEIRNMPLTDNMFFNRILKIVIEDALDNHESEIAEEVEILQHKLLKLRDKLSC